MAWSASSRSGLDVVACAKVLKRSNANVTCRHAGEHSARQEPFRTHDCFRRCHGRERSSRGHAERGHGFADDVFADHRAESGLAIAAAREWRAPGALQLQIVTCAISVDDFTEQEGTAVAELRHESTELMAGVGLCNRLGAFGHRVAREHRETVR